MAGFLVRLYAFQFFDSFILIFPLYVVMFADAGLSPMRIAIVLTAWSITAFVLNVPAGVLADRWPRRRILALAQVARASCFVVWWLVPHFWGFLVGLMLWGVKSAFTSGTFEALLYDELKATGRSTQYARVFGRTRAIRALGAILASLGAAAIAGHGYGPALIASEAAVILAAVTAATLPVAAPVLAIADRDPLGHLKRGLALALGDGRVISILAVSALILALGGALEEFWPVFGAQVGLSRPMIALFVGVQYGLEAIGSLNAHRVSRLGARWLYGVFIAAGGLLIGAAALFSAPAMALLALYSGLMRLLEVAFDGRLQSLIPSENRATIGSVKGFAGQTGITVLYLTLGPLAQATSYRLGFITFGLIGAAAGAMLWARGGSASARSADHGP